MPHATQMSATDTGLLIIDVQEKLVPKIDQVERMLCNIHFLVDAASALDMTVQATEQYPKGLGATVPDLAAKLPHRPDKTAFSCCAVAEVAEKFRSTGRPKVVLAGIETHVCVLQTALDLLAQDFRVYVAADAVSSRYPIDKEFGLRRMERAGCILVTSEMAAFEWVGGSSHPRFKQISTLVQERMKKL